MFVGGTQNDTQALPQTPNQRPAFESPHRAPRDPSSPAADGEVLITVSVWPLPLLYKKAKALKARWMPEPLPSCSCTSAPPPVETLSCDKRCLLISLGFYAGNRK